MDSPHPFGGVRRPAVERTASAVTLVAERVMLHPDPTTHLLAAFAIELATVWLAVWTYVHLRGYTLTGLVRPRAARDWGMQQPSVMPAPTLERPTHSC